MCVSVGDSVCRRGIGGMCIGGTGVVFIVVCVGVVVCVRVVVCIWEVVVCIRVVVCEEHFKTLSAYCQGAVSLMLM